MSFTALDLTRKAGDLIKCEDWNKSMQEIERLGRDKVDSVDGALSGTLSIDEKLTIRSAENNLLIDSTKEGELSMKTGRQSDQLIFGNGEDRALTIRENKVGIGTDDPREMLDVNGHVRAKPIIGQWCPSAHGPVVNDHYLMVFDRELLNTSPSYFERSSDNLRIKMKVAGFYQISVRALIYMHFASHSHLYLSKNNTELHGGTVLDMDHGHYYYPRSNSHSWDDRHNEYVGFFEADEFITVRTYRSNNPTHHIYHSGPYYSRLSITKLN